MDRRTKILAGLFGLVAVYVVFDRAVYPAWIEPLLTIDERIAAKREELGKLEALEQRVHDAKHRYRTFAERDGSFDVGTVETSVRAKLTELIDRHGLTDRRVSTTGRTKDKKTDISRMLITVKATGTLQQAIGFLKDVRELPQLARVGNVKLSPLSSGSARARPGQEPINLTAPVEVWVLPQQRIVGHLKEEELKQPDTYVRHEDRDYSPIWKATPFSEWVPPVPLMAKAGPSVHAKPGDRVSLRGTVHGGLKPYKVQWSPDEGLSDPTRLMPTVDTTTVVLRVYTLTVTDQMGSTATDRVTVNVKEPAVAKAPVNPSKPKIPQRPPGPKRWKNGRYRQIRSALISTSSNGTISEVMLYNSRAKQTEYFAVGAAFDGGELVFVHPTGAVVRRKSRPGQAPDYVIYPIGAMCDEDLPDTNARVAEYPQLAVAAARFRAADEKAANDQAATEKTQTSPVKGKVEAGGAGADRPLSPASKGGGKNAGERAKRDVTSDPGKRRSKPETVRPNAARPKPKASAQAAFRLRQYQQQKRRHGRPPG